MADQPKTADDVKAIVEERDIRFIRFWFTDVLGQLKSFSDQRRGARRRLRGRHGLRRLLDHRLQRDRGVGHDRHAGPVHVRGPAVAARGRSGVARMFCDVVTPSREPYEGDPRYVLRRALERAQSMGFDAFNVGPELEFFYFRTAKLDGGIPEVLDEGGYFDLTTLDAGSDVRRETVLALEQLGIHVEYTHHEVGPSQHEIDMRYAPALKMADDCMTYRITVKEYAMKYGWHATFMPKPLFGENGSGMHTHQSLFKRGPQRLLRRRRPVLPVARRQGVHRRPAQARARDLVDLRPVGELLQAARARATRRRSTSPGRAATARRSCGCRSTTPARSRPRAWSCAAPTPRATRT